MLSKYRKLTVIEEISPLPPIGTIISIARQVITFAKDIKSLFGGDPNKGISDKLDTIIYKLDQISEQLSAINGKLDQIQKLIEGLYEKIDEEGEKILREQLFGHAVVLIQKLPSWIKYRDEPVDSLVNQLDQLQVARQSVMQGRSLDSTDALAYAMVTESIMYALIIRSTDRRSIREQYTDSVRIYADYFGVIEQKNYALLDQANSVISSTQSRIAELSVPVDRSAGSIAPPGPYMAVGRIGRCIEIQKCNGSLEDGYSVLTAPGGLREGLSWTRDTVHYPPFLGDPQTCHSGDHNEVQNNYPLTTLDVLNDLSSAFQSARIASIARDTNIRNCQTYQELARPSSAKPNSL